MACHAAAQRVTRSYRHAPLSQVLTDLDNASERYTVNFIYNELEDFTVTTDFRNRTIPEAVRDVLGFYPMQLTVGDSLIFVECRSIRPAVPCLWPTSPCCRRRIRRSSTAA